MTDREGQNPSPGLQSVLPLQDSFDFQGRTAVSTHPSHGNHAPVTWLTDLTPMHALPLTAPPGWYQQPPHLTSPQSHPRLHTTSHIPASPPACRLPPGDGRTRGEGQPPTCQAAVDEHPGACGCIGNSPGAPPRKGAAKHISHWGVHSDEENVGQGAHAQQRRECNPGHHCRWVGSRGGGQGDACCPWCMRTHTGVLGFRASQP